MATDVALHYAQASDGVRIAYIDVGDGTPIVFASNIFGDAFLYRRLPIHPRGLTDGLTALGWRVVRYDVRGMGSSDRGIVALDLEARVRDLAAVTARLGLERFALAGTDIGAATAPPHKAWPPTTARPKRSSLGSYVQERRERGPVRHRPEEIGWSEADQRGDRHSDGDAGEEHALPLLLSGYAVAVDVGKQWVSTPGHLAPGSLQFLIIPLGGLFVFATLVGFGFHLRSRPEFHRRLMLLATIELLNAAVDRLPGVGAAGLAPFYLGTDIFVLALAAYDLAVLGRVHRATLWGGGFLVATQIARVMLADTAGWLAIATWLTT